MFTPNNSNYHQNLAKLSNIIKIEGSNLRANLNDLTSDLTHRSSSLWYKYFSKGICLSNGGVASSFIQFKDIANNPRIRFFNMYREEASPLTQELLRNFMVEENAVSHENSNNIDVAFCLGSHEGAMRVARCIYSADKNNGMFFPSGSYGLLAVGLNDLKPFNYDICLVQSDPHHGKISLPHLRELIKKYPTYRTLVIDLKTTCGAVYTRAEITDIIQFCKENKLFFIADAAHNNMHFEPSHKLPDVVNLCQKEGFHDFVVMYTSSKTYGMERARAGFIVLDKKCQHLNIQDMEGDFNGVFGTVSDLPIQAAYGLVNSPLNKRIEYLESSVSKHRYNMNLMTAYIEGVDSPKIDADLRETIKSEIDPKYHSGIDGLRVIYKPECGIQMKIDTSGLTNKYLTNIRMFNSEIFCYALNIMAGVVTLHSYQIMDPSGFGMRLSFSIKEDVHNGMMTIHDFVSSLTDQPSSNPYLSDVKLAEDLIFDSNKQLTSGLMPESTCASFSTSNTFFGLRNASFNTAAILNSNKELRSRL